GRVLAMLFFDPPMSMPCHGSATTAVWASDNGSVNVFTPVTLAQPSTMCDSPQFMGFGSGLVLEGGGVAFRHRTKGWYASYPSGSASAQAPPAWLSAYDDKLKHLPGAGAYLTTTRDPGTCRRTAEIVGPSGQ